jgi:hypothetical protein
VRLTAGRLARGAASEGVERGSSGWDGAAALGLAREGRAGFSAGATAATGAGAAFLVAAFLAATFLAAGGVSVSALAAFLAGARLGFGAAAAGSEKVADGSALMLGMKRGLAEVVGDVVRDVEVGVNVLGVIVFGQHLVEMDDLIGYFDVGEEEVVVGHVDEHLAAGFVAFVFEGGADEEEIFDRGVEDPIGAVGGDVVGTAFEGDFGGGVLVKGGFGEADFALALELVGDAAGIGKGAVIFVEEDTEVGGGAVAVVGDDFDEEGGATGAVGFIESFIGDGATEIATAFFDGAVDVVIGHVLGLRSQDGGAEAGVHVRVGAAELGRDGDLLGELAEDSAAFGVNDCLETLDFGPFVVASHLGG